MLRSANALTNRSLMPPGVSRSISACWMEWRRMVRPGISLTTRREDFWPMNDLYRAYFAEGDFPARTTIIAGLPIDDMLIEIECVAEVEPQ